MISHPEYLSNDPMKKMKLRLNFRKCQHIIFPAVFVLLLTFAGAFGQEKKVKNSPVFSDFVYQGDDQVYKDYPLEPDEFYNPILQGCYPDPSITRKGDDYYLVCSSFAMFPGVPIFHSKDLVNWKQIGHVLDRVSQLKVHDTGISAGVYAPQIIYNPHNDTFYMITTEFAGGFGNIVVKTKEPEKGWSDPIKLEFNGIDPSLFFDDNGKAYVVHNDAPERGKELYNGHRVIKIWEYDVDNDKIISGTDQVIVDGGVDLSKKPIWIEAPHMYKKDGRYYLMCAEGGTGGWHSEVIFSSDNPKGPYKPAPGNPILTQRYFSKDRINKVDWAGHADLVKGPGEKYYVVFLAVRPNEKNRVNTGRETFILPVDWSGEFPVFINGLIPLEPKLKMPNGVMENKTGREGFFPNGNFSFTDDFDTEKLDDRWIGLRGPREEFISVTEEGLMIHPFETSIKELKTTSTLFYRQQHNRFSFAVTMDYKPGSEKELAGIVALQSENSNYVFGITKQGDDYCLLLERNQKLRRSREMDSKIVASSKIEIKKPIRLQVKAVGDDYEFSYSTNGTDFVNLGGTVSGDILSTDVAGGFTGCLLGLYATSANDAQPE
jgi:xylan 1,4-beta-xylosidase